MSRFLKVMIVLLAIAAMVAPAMAEDRLSLGGQMRVRSWHKDYDQDATNTYADQRLRVGGKLSVAEGVSITFRTDITETKWGDGGSSYGAGRGGDTQQWDRAHIDLTIGNSHFRAGQQYAGYGLAQTINSQDAGIRYDYKGDISFSTFLLLDDNNNSSKTADEYVIDNDKKSPTYGTIVLKDGKAAKNNADAFLFGANVGHKGDNYKANLFVGNQNDGAEENVYLIGVDTVYTMDAFTIKGEFDYFTGDANDDDDAFGTQFMLDVAMAASEQFTIGGQFYYAAGDDKDVQYTYLGNDFNGYDPLFDIGTSLSDEQIMVGRPFDLVSAIVSSVLTNGPDSASISGASSGVVGARLYTSFKASDKVNLSASAAYMEPEEDKNFKDFDSANFYAVGATYALMANTSLQAQFEYIDVDVKGTKVDSAVLGGVGLFVNF